MQTVLEELVETARAAGALLRERFGQPRAIEKKGAIDLVTDADRAAEALILARLGREFPGAPVLAEESGAGAGSGALRFVVDPLDGTTNYAHGVPHFATTIACLDATGVVAGVTYDPLRGELFTALRGAGAALDGRPLTLGPAAALDDAVLATGVPYDVREPSGEKVLRLMAESIRRSRAVRRFGSAALDLAWVAAGRYDGYFERGLRPWDMAAGLLLVAEAGGTCVDYRGAPVDLARGECVAGPAPLVRELVALTQAEFP